MPKSKSLLYQPAARITRMTATIYEQERDLLDESRQNATYLRRCGATVIYGVDATHLEKSLQPQQFDTITFQFPNVGSREAKYDRNPNYIMVRKFLRSAAPYLKSCAQILVSAVDTAYYRGIFQFDEAATFAGYEMPAIYPFDPAMFTGYSHTNTNDDKSALDEHNRFATWVFRLKK